MNKIMKGGKMMVLITVLLFFVGGMAVSLVVVIYLTINPSALRHFLMKPIKPGARWELIWRVLQIGDEDQWKYFFFVSVGIGVTVISVLLIEPLLFFIPESWGSYNEDGEFLLTRLYLAVLIGFTAAFGIGRLLSKYV
jgi:hypothetical protein